MVTKREINKTLKHVKYNITMQKLNIKTTTLRFKIDFYIKVIKILSKTRQISYFNICFAN